MSRLRKESILTPIVSLIIDHSLVATILASYNPSLRSDPLFQLDLSRSSILDGDSSSPDNVTVSVIVLQPGAGDDGADLACRAAHTGHTVRGQQHSHASDAVRISIQCELMQNLLKNSLHSTDLFPFYRFYLSSLMSCLWM